MNFQQIFYPKLGSLLIAILFKSRCYGKLEQKPMKFFRFDSYSLLIVCCLCCEFYEAGLVIFYCKTLTAPFVSACTGCFSRPNMVNFTHLLNLAPATFFKYGQLLLVPLCNRLCKLFFFFFLSDYTYRVHVLGYVCTTWLCEWCYFLNYTDFK